MSDNDSDRKSTKRLLIDFLAFVAGALGAVPIALAIAVPFVIG